VLRNATIREVSPAVFSSGSARSAHGLYKATVQRNSQCSLRAESSESQCQITVQSQSQCWDEACMCGNSAWLQMLTV
jgi:hypothetical protein